jgi:tRNA(Ile)-lysidine synthase
LAVLNALTSSFDSRSEPCAPLGSKEFESLMDLDYESCPTVAVGVSGGSDSLSLCLLANDWAKAHSGKVIALTVDHGLRPESKSEAETVKSWLQAHAIEHHILTWKGEKPQTRIQEEARKARYNLLKTFCYKNGILHLLLGHHQEDQVETVLDRFLHGTGLDGLAGIAPVVEHDHVRVIRPLLTISKVRLMATLSQRHQAFLDDPSNQSDKFTRSRLRKILSSLESEGGTASRLAQVAYRSGLSRAALDEIVNDVLVRNASLHGEGYISLKKSALEDTPKDIALRVLMRTIQCIGGNAYPPRQKSLEPLLKALQREENPKTLGNCYFLPRKKTIIICREAIQIPEAFPIPHTDSHFVWNERFMFKSIKSLPQDSQYLVRPFGEKGLHILPADFCPTEPQENIPGPVLYTLPAIWNKEKLVSVPHIRYGLTKLEKLGLQLVGFAPTYALGKPPYFSHERYPEFP